MYISECEGQLSALRLENPHDPTTYECLGFSKNIKS